MKGKLFFCLMLLALIVLPLYTACTGTATPSKLKTLRVGSLSQMTDWYATWDAQNDRELRVFAEILNNKGGIKVKGDTYNIEIVTEDGMSTLEGTTTAAQKLVYDDKVKYIVNTSGFFLLGAIPIFEQEKIVNISNCMTLNPGELNADTKYAFVGHNCLAANYFGSISALKKYFPDVDKVLYIQPDDGSFAFYGPLIENTNKAAGFTMLDHIMWPPDTVDYSSVAAKINSYKDAEAVIAVGIPPGLGPICKGLRTLGNNMPFVFQGAFSTADIVTLTGPEAATNVISLAVIPGESSNPPLLNELATELEKKHGPGPFVTNYANCLYLMKQVIEAAQSLDTALFVNKWESMDTIDTLYGPGKLGGCITFGICKHYVTHRSPTELLMNGKVVDYGWVDVGSLP